MSIKRIRLVVGGVAAALVAASALSAAAATTYYWTGAAGDGNFLNVANYSGNPFAAWGDYIVFTNTAPLSLHYPKDVNDMDRWPAKIYVRNADVYLGREEGSAEKTAKLQNQLYPEIFVEAGAVFSVTNSIIPYNANARFSKTGDGVLEMCGSFDKSGNFTNATVAAGTMRIIAANGIAGSIASKRITVKGGARFELVGRSDTNMLSPTQRIVLEKDAVMSLNGSTVWCSDVSGEGDVVAVEGRDATLQMQFGGSTNTVFGFDGTFSGPLWLVSVGSTAKRFILKSEDALANIKGLGIPDAFTWKAGVTRPTIHRVTGNYTPSGSLRLEDENGDPITVVTKIETPSTLGAVGAGDLVITNSGEIALRGSNYKATGLLRAGEGTILKLSTGASNGTGDFDFVDGNPSRLDVDAGGMLNFCGTVSNVVAIPVTGAGTVQVASVAKRFEDFRANVRQFLGDARVEFAGGDGAIRAWKGHGGAARVHRFSGGRYIGYRDGFAPVDPASVLTWPRGVEFTGASGWYSVENTGAELHTVFGSGHKNMFLRGGRTFVYGDCSLSSSKNAIADGGNAQLEFDGGELVFRRTSSSVAYHLVSTTTRNLTSVRIGAKGGRLTIDNPVPGSRMDLYFESEMVTQTNTAAAGLLDVSGYSSVWFSKPLLTDGGLRVAGGRLVLQPGLSADTTAFLGTGDFMLDNACTLYQKDWKTDGDLHLATDAGSAFRFFGASRFGARLDWSITQGQTVTAGALARGEKGAVLLLSDAQYATWGDKTKFFVTGGVATDEASGLPHLPVIIGTDLTHHFAEYDAACGMKVYSRYATSLDAGKDAVVLLSDNPTLSGTAQVAGVRVEDYRNITVKDGARLVVGNGTDPAMILFGSSGRLYGSGTIDFGTSEGVLVAGNTYKSDPHDVRPSFAGSNGLSILGFSCGETDSKLRLSGASTYTGGTWINGVEVFADNAQAFSSGTVQVGNASPTGGRVRLNVADGVFANAFSLGGVGPQDTALGHEKNGCLCFDKSGEISGAVELRHAARVAVAEDVEGKISGTVSGDRLQVYDSTGVLELAGANVHTGGTAVVSAKLAIRSAAALGTGELLLDNGTLICRNATDMTVANGLSGVGTVQMLGAGKVSFSGATDGFTGTLDVAGRSLRVDALEPFAGVTNSVRKYAELTLAAPGAYRLDPSLVGGRVGIVLEKGATLDVGGGTLNVFNFIGDTADVNGTVVSEGGPKGLTLIVR